jgi:hypothetical protein
MRILNLKQETKEKLYYNIFSFTLRQFLYIDLLCMEITYCNYFLHITLSVIYNELQEMRNHKIIIYGIN